MCILAYGLNDPNPSYLFGGTEPSLDNNFKSAVAKDERNGFKV